MTADKTYEMLWDCRYCGQKKLLGLTHRHCPSCGAPQDTTARYFPPDDERVAVEDHQLVGSDVTCPSCREANARQTKHCRHCGGPLEAASGVATRSDVVTSEGQAFGGETKRDARADLAGRGQPQQAPPKRARWPWIVGALGVVVAVALVLFVWKRDVGLRVAGHEWRREIAVERFAEVTESDWCDSLPAGARVTSRRDKQRTTQKVPDGETCKVRKVDNGDGTYSEKLECEPKYRSEPVMAPYCTYVATKWTVTRTETRSGGLGDPPAWPEVRLARAGSCLGCEREGARTERYRVDLVDPASAEPSSCEVPEVRWRALKEGATIQAQQRLTGGIVCDAL